MDDISDIKELVAQALTRKRVLSKLRAELRSHVFLTIDEEETGGGGEGLGKKTSNGSREAFVGTPEGQLIVDLVHEFLQWCNLEFTLRVFEPEIDRPAADYMNRSQLARELDLPVSSASEGPLLLSLLQGHSHSRERAEAGTFIQSGLPPRPVPAQPRSLAPLAPLNTPSHQQPQQPLDKDPSSGGGAASDDSYSLEVESDVGLDDAEVLEEEEDYAQAVASGQGSSWRPSPAPAPAPTDDPSEAALFGPISGDIPRQDRDREVPSTPQVPRSLAPLAPIGKAPLAPLAPIGAGGGGGLKPMTGGLKQGTDIKDELRRAGLLTLPADSFSGSETSMDMPSPSELEQGITQRAGTGGAAPSRLSASSLPTHHRLRMEDLGGSIDVGQSLDLHEPGLSPSDKSGDIDKLFDNADCVETAEWDN